MRSFAAAWSRCSCRRRSSASRAAKSSAGRCSAPEIGGLGRMSTGLQPVPGWSR